MKRFSNYRFLIFMIVVLFIGFISCEPQEDFVLDVNSGEEGLVSFTPPPNVFREFGVFHFDKEVGVVFNPELTSTTTIDVDVSHLKNTDRTIYLKVGEGAGTTNDGDDLAGSLDYTHLDETLYNIDRAVIPANSHFGEVVISTTPDPDGLVLPLPTDVIAIHIDSVQGGAKLGRNSIPTNLVRIDVECPDFDLNAVVGTYDILSLDFLGTRLLGEFNRTREVVEGPGENQLTIVGGVYLNGMGEDFILTYDPENGNIIEIENTLAISGPFGITDVRYQFKEGGNVTSCIGQIVLSFDLQGPPQFPGNRFINNSYDVPAFTLVKR